MTISLDGMVLSSCDFVFDEFSASIVHDDLLWAWTRLSRRLGFSALVVGAIISVVSRIWPDIGRLALIPQGRTKNDQTVFQLG